MSNRTYTPLDTDKLNALEAISAAIQGLPSAADIVSLNENLSRVASALERMTGSHAQTADAPSAGWTIADNNGVTLCTGDNGNVGGFVFSALTEYAKRNAPELTFVYNGADAETF